jgi:TRAP-type mannitol/chloroaromatic compound transport system substrate-binding protein
VWNALADELKAIVAHACAAEANYALAEMEWLNAQALEALIKDHGVKLAAFPDDVVAAARQEAHLVMMGFAVCSDITGRISGSYDNFRERTAPWSRVSIEAVLRARG